MQTPPVPLITFVPVEVASQQIPVLESSTSPALQAAAAGGAVSSGADTSPAAQTAAKATPEAVMRIFMCSP